MTGRSATTDDDAPPTRSAPSRRPTRARWPGTPWPPPTSPSSSTPTGSSWTATTSRRSRASWRSSATGSSRASRAVTTSSCSAASVVRYVLPERRDGQSVPEVLDLLEDNGLRRRGRLARPLGARVPGRRRRSHVPGDRAPGDRAHRAVAAAGGQDRGQGRRGQRRRRRHRLAPARRDRPPHPVAQGREGDDELNGPDLRPYAGHGTFIAGVVRCVAPETRIYVEGFAIGGVGGGGILESDLVVQLEQALRHDPQVINLSAGCRTRRDRPSIPLRKFHRRHLRGARLRARRGRRQRLLGGALLAGRLRLVRRRRLARPRRARLELLQLRGLRRRLRPGPQPGQRVPRRHVRVQRDAGQGRHPGLQHRHGAVERHVVLSAGRGRRSSPARSARRARRRRTRATPC